MHHNNNGQNGNMHMGNNANTNGQNTQAQGANGQGQMNQGMQGGIMGQQSGNSQYTNPYINQGQGQNSGFGSNSTSSTPNYSTLLGNIDTGALLKGALIGAAATYLLTNENVQKTLFKAVAKMGDFAGAGLEELKERYEDAKAEVEAEKEQQA